MPPLVPGPGGSAASPFHVRGGVEAEVREELGGAEDATESELLRSTEHGRRGKEVQGRSVCGGKGATVIPILLLSLVVLLK